MISTIPFPPAKNNVVNTNASPDMGNSGFSVEVKVIYEASRFRFALVTKMNYNVHVEARVAWSRHFVRRFLKNLKKKNK